MNMIDNSMELKYLKSLAVTYPTAAAASTEIINLHAIMNLPKGTEHFITDVHGEYEQVLHTLRTGSGAIKEKIDDVFGNTLRNIDKKRLAALIYYPDNKLKDVLEVYADDPDNLEDWYRITLNRLIMLAKECAQKYTRSKLRKCLPKEYAYILEELLSENNRVQAKQAYYAAIVEEIANVEKKRYEAEMRLYELQERQEELLRSGAQAVNMYAYTQAAAAGTADQFWASLSEEDRALYEVALEIQNTERALAEYDAEIERHEGKLQDAIDAQERMADSTKDLKTKFQEAFSGMKIGMDESMRELLDRARTLGYDTGLGIAKGVRDSTPEVESAFERLAKKGQGAYMHTMDQHSPSRVMRAKGKDSGRGAALGVEDSIPDMERAMAALAEAGQESYAQRQLEHVAQYPSMMQGVPGYGGGTTTNTRNVAYGGISININTQPGQDAQSIADVVLAELTVRLGQEEASW